MTFKLKKCSKCKQYNLTDTCRKCKNKTSEIHYKFIKLRDQKNYD